MRSILFLTAFLCSCAVASPATLSKESLVGTWLCGPTTMHGPNFDIVVTMETTNAADNTYTSLTTSAISPHGKDPITTKDRAFGTWQLDGDVITSHVQKVEFLSSSDPSISNEFGQQVQDAQLKKKSTYHSRILEFTGDTSRSVPVNSMYKEAVVESSCERV